MKKKLHAMMFTILVLFVSLAACENGERETSDMYGFQLNGNGGTMTFSDSEEEPYEADAYTYWMDEGQSLKDVITEEDATYSVMETIDQLDKEFTGWTVYKGDHIAWSAEENEESNVTSFLSGLDGEDFKYVLLENCEVYSESVATDELFAIVCDGSSYYAVANWK